MIHFLADFWAISCSFGPTKNFFETDFIILLHIQLQEAIFNQSVKSTSNKNCATICNLPWRSISHSLPHLSLITVPGTTHIFF